MNKNNNTNQEQNNKHNKFVAWWLGLGKWAKIGICAGTAAVLATAITLPIVLTKKSGTFDGEQINVEYNEEDKIYSNKNAINLVKNKKYLVSVEMLKFTEKKLKDNINLCILKDKSFVTLQYAKDFAVKSNKTVFKHCGQTTDTEYFKIMESNSFVYFVNEDTSAVVLGKNSFSTDNNKITFAFTTLLDLPNAYIAIHSGGI